MLFSSIEKLAKICLKKSVFNSLQQIFSCKSINYIINILLSFLEFLVKGLHWLGCDGRPAALLAALLVFEKAEYYRIGGDSVDHVKESSDDVPNNAEQNDNKKFGVNLLLNRIVPLNQKVANYSRGPANEHFSNKSKGGSQQVQQSEFHWVFEEKLHCIDAGKAEGVRGNNHLNEPQLGDELHNPLKASHAAHQTG